MMDVEVLPLLGGTALTLPGLHDQHFPHRMISIMTGIENAETDPSSFVVTIRVCG